MDFKKEIKKLKERVEKLESRGKVGDEGTVNPTKLEVGCKFKVGDKIIGNEKANQYIHTCKGWVGYVIKVYNMGRLIKVADEKDYLFGFEVECNCFDLYEEPKFTEDEKVILRNLPKEYNWIVRDNDNHIYISDKKPKKPGVYWYIANKWECLHLYQHLFKSIQWTDKEPCEFRKYI